MSGKDIRNEKYGEEKLYGKFQGNEKYGEERDNGR